MRETIGERDVRWCHLDIFDGAGAAIGTGASGGIDRFHRALMLVQERDRVDQGEVFLVIAPRARLLIQEGELIRVPPRPLTSAHLLQTTATRAAAQQNPRAKTTARTHAGRRFRCRFRSKNRAADAPIQRRMHVAVRAKPMCAGIDSEAGFVSAER